MKLKVENLLKGCDYKSKSIYKNMNKKFFSRNITSFFIISFLLFFVYSIYYMLISIYFKQLGFSESFVGNLYSAQTLASALASPFSAFLISKFGIKRSLNLGSILIFLSILGHLYFINTFLLILMAILCGFAFSIHMTGEAMFLTANSTNDSSVKVFSYNFAIKNSGMMLANIAGGYLCVFFSNFFKPFLCTKYSIFLSIFFSLLSMIFIYRLDDLKFENCSNLKSTLISYKSLFKKSILLLMFYNSIIGFGAGMVVPFFSIYLKYAVYLSDALVGKILSFSQLGCVLGGFFMPILTKKLGKVNSVVFCQILSIPFLISIAFTNGWIFLIYTSFFARSALMNMSTPIIQNLSMDMVNIENASNLSSLLALSSNFSRAFGIFLGGYLMDFFNYNTPYYFTVVLYLFGTLLFKYLYSNPKNTIQNKKIS